MINHLLPEEIEEFLRNYTRSVHSLFILLSLIGGQMSRYLKICNMQSGGGDRLEKERYYYALGRRNV